MYFRGRFSLEDDLHFRVLHHQPLVCYLVVEELHLSLSKQAFLHLEVELVLT